MIDLETIYNIKIQTKQTYAQLAAKYTPHYTGEQLRYQLRLHKRIQIPEPHKALFDPPIYAPQRDTLIIADLHAPYQNAVLLRKAIEVAKAAGVTDVDIAGDLLNFDELSPHGKKEPVTPYTVDIEAARQILRVLQNTFSDIYIMSGNHDRYYTKKKDAPFTDLICSEVLQGKTQGVHVTNYDYIFRGDDWIIGHLTNYDPSPGVLAAQIADKYNRHALVGHDHLLGITTAKNGRLGVSIGAMLQPDRFWYKVRGLDTYPHFQLGFAIIKNNQLYLFSDTGNTINHGKVRSFDYWINCFKNGENCT